MPILSDWQLDKKLVKKVLLRSGHKTGFELVALSAVTA
jgi:hypothetical protein